MTEQRKSLIKLISAVIIILLLPVLFFRFIGDDPTKKAVNSTRQIAVVNEDTGVLSDEVKSDEEDKSAQFGKEVAAVLGERPDYSWTVVNRSAAETGLASKKYDAIVYIPSDFSKNILSYDKDHPQKATLEFSIQDNLNAVNKEKVQRELEDAQKTMNKKMSALYWNFVSQKVDNIRGEFDKIVNKESEFQNVMYNFYKPSSNDLAGEIKQQKDLIDELKKSMNEAQGTTKEKASTAEEAKNTLKEFIDTVERYKEYQENQKKLLLAAQDSTQQQIRTGLDAIQAQQKANQFSERMSGLATGISQAKSQLGIAGLAMNDAKKARQDQVPLQEMGMGQQGNVKSVLALSPEESASWEALKNNTMQTDEDINSFIDGMTKFADDYSAYIRDSQAGVLDELTKISESAAKASEQLVTGATQESATFSNDGLSGTMALSVQDTVGQEVLQMSDMMGSLSDRQSGIIDYTTNMQQSVNDVQAKADTLNNNWGKNVASTKLVRNDVYGILGNTLVDGQNNGYVYDYLANPLKISGEVPEEKIQTVPPVVILVIVLISSLLIGYFSSYYQNAPLLVKGALFGILNILVGLMISLFGLNIYSLPDDQTIKWSVFTILLLVASSAFIRTAFRFGSIPGWVASAAMILFYVAPLIDLIMPNFTFEDPVSKVYIDIQYGTGHLFTMGITVLLIITVIAAALPLIIRLMAEHTAESDETYEA
ncbi:Hypothetical protein ACI5QM_03173 [Bacillus subtilis]